MSHKRSSQLMNHRGATVVELIVSSVIVFVGMAAFTSFYINSLKLTKNIQLSGTSNKVVSRILENIRNVTHQSQINFDYSQSASKYLDVSSLPMAWDSGSVGTPAKCPECKGRYGYTIQPYENYRGLYLVTIRMTHPSWGTGPEDYKDYTFITSPK